MEMNKYIEPTKQHEGQMVEVRDYDRDRWLSRKLLAVLPKPQKTPFLCECNDDKEACRGWLQARVSVPKTYKDLHSECGLKVGDWVKVLRSFSAGEGGFDKAFTWYSQMEKAIGNAYEVVGMYPDCVTIHLGCTGFGFPCFVLEKVDPPATPSDEIIHVPGMIEHWIYKGHAYRLATELDIGKQVYRSDLDFKTAIEYGLVTLHGIEASEFMPYVVGCSWKFAYIQDDSLLKPTKDEYEPYTWEDRHEIRDKWYRNRDGYESRVGRMVEADNGSIQINELVAEYLLAHTTHLDENGKDTGIPFGKKKVK